MAGNDNAANQGEDQPGGRDDWEAKYLAEAARSAELERRASENEAAAAELAKLKEEQMSEAERERARADAAEAKAAALQAERDRAAWAKAAAAKTGVPADVLELMGADSEEDMMAKAAKAAGRLSQQSVPVVPGDGRSPSEPPSATADQWLRGTLPRGLRMQ